MDKNLKKIIPFAKRYKKNVYLNILFNILYALFSTIGMVMIFPVLKVLFGNEEKVVQLPTYQGLGSLSSYLNDTLFYYVTLYTEQYGTDAALMFTISLVITTFLLKNAFSFFGMQQLMYLKNGVLKDLRVKMYQKIISLPIAYYSEKRKGDVMARMLGDINEVQNSFFAILELIVKEPLTIVFSLIAMINISWKLTLFVFVFIPLSGLIISRIGKTLKKSSTEAQQESGLLISIVEESLSGLKIIKGFNAEGIFQQKFNRSVNRLYDLSNTIGKKNNLASPLSEFLGIVVIAVLLFYGGSLVLVDQSLDGSLFIAYVGLAYNILTPAKSISRASYQVKNGMAAAERVFEVLETENVVANKKGEKIQDFSKNIQLQGVGFSYDTNKVLNNIDLEIQKGKTVALVGQSGSGKSTIANLLLRFYDCNQGQISIDGKDIKNLELDSLRKNIGFVSQESIMFNDTIAENLKIGKPDATEEEIIQALKIANAYEFVKDLPQGIHTNIGDAGGKLSGGQKQRLSIARAVLKNPPIMVLDEATSALDTESERLVQDALDNMMKNRTSVVIAHRLSTIKKADTIVVMHQGKIIEKGTHDELLLQNGTYAKLVALQSFDE